MSIWCGGNSLIALGKSFNDIVGLDTSLKSIDARIPPASTAVQLRITAEDVKHDFSLSIGRIRRVLFAGGNGIRTDTHLCPGVVVSADFDPLLAKLIVTSPDWHSAVAKAERALQDVLIDGVTTNLGLLLGIVRSADFRGGHFDTNWLERHLKMFINPSKGPPLASRSPSSGSGYSEGHSSAKPSASSGQLIRKGDQFKIEIEGSQGMKAFEDLVSITSVLRNDFPESLAVKMSTLGTNGLDSSSDTKKQESYTVRLLKHSETQRSLAGSLNQSTTRGDPSQLICPVAGQIVELLTQEGEVVAEGEAVIIVRQIKMEPEVRAHRSGIVQSLVDLNDGDSVTVGMAICSIIPADREKL